MEVKCWIRLGSGQRSEQGDRERYSQRNGSQQNELNRASVIVFLFACCPENPPTPPPPPFLFLPTEVLSALG